MTEIKIFGNIGGAISIGFNHESYQDKSYIVKCSFINNGVTHYGGAIYNPYNNLEINNCSFYLNYANSQGGAMYTGAEMFL